MISEFCIRRPIFAAVISIVLTLVGALAVVALPVARYPQIEPPNVEVKAFYPGASAATVAETVASPIEVEVNGVQGMEYMTSTCSSNGDMTLTIVFEVGVDPDMATVLVQNRVNAALPKLPEESTRQGVTTEKKSNDLTVVICLYSPDDSLDPIFLSNYNTLYVMDELLRVTGVGTIDAFGAGDYGMRVWLDPDKLRVRNLTTNDVVAAIREQNVQVAAGQIGAAPAPEGQSFQFTVNTLGQLSEVSQFEQIVVRSVGERQIRVKDVARVELGAKTYDMTCRLNGKPAEGMIIYPLPGANTIDMVDGVRAKLEELKQRFPAGLDYAMPVDSTTIIRASIAELITTLFITIALVILVVYMFLQDWRATLIPVATIPVSLIATFAVMLPLGFSLNQCSLFGLVLVVGIVVDDAIVVVENCSRHLNESKMGPKEAAVAAMREMTGPIVATTLVLLAVFIPTAFMGGITGQLFQQFALTISIATVFSSINALTLSPALAGILMRPSPKKLPGPFRLFNRGLEATTEAYGKVVSGFLRAALIGVLLFLGLAYLAGQGFAILPTGFVPQEDEGRFMVNVQLPDAASQERTQAVVDQVATTVAGVPGVTDVVSFGGYSILDSAVSSNTGFLFVTTEDWDQRTEPELVEEAIVARINAELAPIQEAICFGFQMPSLPGLGFAGGFAVQIQDRGGAGFEALQDAAQTMVASGNAQTGLTALFSGFSARVPQLYVDVDRQQVKALGIGLQSVFDTLQAYLGSAYVNDFIMQSRTFQVRAQAESEFRARAEDIVRLEVRNERGQMIPLGSVLSVEENFGPTVVTRHNLYPSAKVTGATEAGMSSGDALDLIEDMARSELSSAMGSDWTDISYQERKAAGGTTIIFLLAIVLVYLVLAAQYESWSVPLAVCLAVPAGLLGAVGGLMAYGITNNVYTQIGIVLLIGLSAKTSILIVEFAKVQRESGMSLFDAALSAAKLRFRAVLMTALSFMLGTIPLLLASGAGSRSRVAIGVAVFYGMMAATILSVLTVPMLYKVIQGASERFFGAPTAQDAPTDDAGAVDS